jgi:hypothetical protein
MIQRIQSLLYLIASVLLITWFFTPIVSYQVTDVTTTFDLCYIKSDKPFSAAPTLPFVAWAPYLVVALALAYLVVIFLYNNRRLQLLVGKALVLGNLVLVVATILAYGEFKDTMPSSGSFAYHFGLFIPLLTLAAAFFANKAVKKDEDLVRAADRLR